MAVDHLDILANQSGNTLGNILVGSAVEAIAADSVLLIVLGGDGITVSLGLHGHMESGIEDSDLGSGGHQLLAGSNAQQVSGVMQGAQGDALFNALDHVLINEAGIGKLVAAVNNAVTDSINLCNGLDDTDFSVNQSVHDGSDGFAVGGHGDFLNGLNAVGIVGQTAIDADTLAQALSGNVTSLGVHQLILKARGAGVDNKNVHWNLPPKKYIS